MEEEMKSLALLIGTLAIFVCPCYSEGKLDVCDSNLPPVSATFILQYGTSQADFEEMKNHAASVISSGLAEGSRVEIYAFENNHMMTVVDTVLSRNDSSWKDDLILFSHKRALNVDRVTLDVNFIEKFINKTMDSDERREKAQMLFIYSASDVKNGKRLLKKTFVFVKAESGDWKKVATDNQHIHVGGWDTGVGKTILQVICKDSHYKCDVNRFRMPNSKECESCAQHCGLQSSTDKGFCRQVCPYYRPKPTAVEDKEGTRKGMDNNKIIFVVVAVSVLFLILLIHVGGYFCCKKLRARRDSVPVEELGNQNPDEENGIGMQLLPTEDSGNRTEMMPVTEVSKNVTALDGHIVDLKDTGRLRGV